MPRILTFTSEIDERIGLLHLCQMRINVYTVLVWLVAMLHTVMREPRLSMPIIGGHRSFSTAKSLHCHDTRQSRFKMGDAADTPIGLLCCDDQYARAR